jgi:hypothetical protein
MGHSIPHSDKEALLDAINRHCAVPVIALRKSNEGDLKRAASMVDPHDPKGFLESVQRILTTGKANPS